MIHSILVLALSLTVTTGEQRRKPPKPRPSPTPTATPSPTPTPTPLASPSPELFQVDEFGQTKATNYDTWNTNGSYRIGGQTILRWDSIFSNFIGGKVATNPVFTGQQNFLFGNMVVCCPSGTGNTTFGWDTGRPTTGDGNTFIGHDAGLGISTGSYNTFIGRASGPPSQSGSIQVSGSIAIGAAANATADSQLVIGSQALPIFDAYLGQGVSSPSPRGITINASGGQGIDNPGSPLTLAGGRSTGGSTPASIYFSVSQRSVISGSAPQALVRRWEITPTGSFRALTPSSKAEINALVMRSPSSFCYEFRVSDTGVMLSTQIVCP